MIFFSKKKENTFQSGELREAAGNVINPGRGWYHIYTYTLGEGLSCDLPPVLYEEETLALVLVDIGAYREHSLDDESLALIDRILQCFAAGGKDMILRIVYDTQGKGMEREPSLFSQVQQHIGQLAPLLVRYSPHILVFQGQLIGSWGEMHTSKFATEKYLRRLSQCFLSLTEGKVRFAVRKPVQCRMVQSREDMEETLTGCFDDAIFASETHLGTFGAQDSEALGWEEPWCPGKEMEFMGRLADRVPFGGEVLSGQQDITASDTVKYLSALCVSYLNCVHEEERLREWRETEYSPGISLYDYIGAHMGYRFVVEKVSFEKKGKESCLAVKLANRGFACCAEEVRFLLYLQDLQAEQEQVISIECEFGRLAGGKELALYIPLGEEQRRSGTRLYGALQRVRDQKTIVFANEGAGEKLLLGLFN